MGWRVEMTAESEAQLIADIQAGLITREDRAVIGKWIAEVEEAGIEIAQRNGAWRDHELEGKWASHRAISFSVVGRIIYRVENDKVIVRVVKVTHDHDYSRGKE
jgi:mRNA-degrading endonuclease YafQ of YafQ-DinJ toxin-antitoxin module